MKPSIPLENLAIDKKNELIILSVLIVFLRKSTKFRSRTNDEVQALNTILDFRSKSYRLAEDMHVNLQYLGKKVITHNMSLNDYYTRVKNFNNKFGISDPNQQIPSSTTLYKQSRTPTKPLQTSLNQDEMIPASYNQLNHETIRLEPELLNYIVDYFIEQLQPNKLISFSIYTSGIHFMLMFFLKEEIESINRVFCELKMPNFILNYTNNYGCQLLDSAVEVLTPLKVLYYDAFNSDSYLLEELLKKHGTAILFQRNNHNKDYFDLLCQSYFDNDAKILASDNKTQIEPYKFFPKEVNSFLSTLPINHHALIHINKFRLIGALGWSNNSAAPYYAMPSPNGTMYDRFKPKELTDPSLNLFHRIFLPGKYGLSLVAITFRTLVYAIQTNINAFIAEMKLRFGTLLSILNELFINSPIFREKLLVGDKKLIPVLANTHESTSGYRCVDIEQFIKYIKGSTEHITWIRRIMEQNGLTEHPCNQEIPTSFTKNIYGAPLYNPYIGLLPSAAEPSTRVPSTVSVVAD